MGQSVKYEGAVYLEKGDLRTLHSRQITTQQSKSVAERVNTAAAALGLSTKGTYVAVEEKFTGQS